MKYQQLNELGLIPLLINVNMEIFITIRLTFTTVLL